MIDICMKFPITTSECILLDIFNIPIVFECIICFSSVPSGQTHSRLVAYTFIIRAATPHDAYLTRRKPLGWLGSCMWCLFQHACENRNSNEFPHSYVSFGGTVNHGIWSSRYDAVRVFAEVVGALHGAPDIPCNAPTTVECSGTDSGWYLWEYYAYIWCTHNSNGACETRSYFSMISINNKHGLSHVHTHSPKYTYTTTRATHMHCAAVWEYAYSYNVHKYLLPSAILRESQFIILVFYVHLQQQRDSDIGATTLINTCSYVG